MASQIYLPLLWSVFQFWLLTSLFPTSTHPPHPGVLCFLVCKSVTQRSSNSDKLPWGQTQGGEHRPGSNNAASSLAVPKTHILVAQMVQNLPAMQETWVWSLDRENPLEKEMATHSGILAWRIHGQRNLAGYSPWGHWRVRNDWMTNTFTFKAHIQPLRAQKPMERLGETFTNGIISISRKVISLLPPCRQIVNSQTSSHSPKSVWEIRMSPLRRAKQMRHHFLKIAVKPAQVSAAKLKSPGIPGMLGVGRLSEHREVKTPWTIPSWQTHGTMSHSQSHRTQLTKGGPCCEPCTWHDDAWCVSMSSS